MAVSTGTFTTTQAKVNREDLANMVDAVQREDTPIYSAINSGDKCKSTYPEWSVRSFAAPGENAQSEGSDFNFSSNNPSSRMGNHTQIMMKDGKFSGTQEAVDNAGRSEQMKQDKLEKGIELRTDVEWAIVAPQASVGGETRKLGGLPTWAETNVSRGAGGVNGGFDDTSKTTVAPTAGTARPLTKGLIDDLLEMSYTSGAKLTEMYMSPRNKRVFAEILQDAGIVQQRDVATKKKNTIIADAEVYIGPNGAVTVHPNHVMSSTAEMASNVIVLDRSRVSFKWLRRIQEVKDLAKTGDYETFKLLGEGTLCVQNEKAVGIIADTQGFVA